MTYWNTIFPLFKASLSSQTYDLMGEYATDAELNFIMRRAVDTFMFPKIDLSYSAELEYETVQQYYFIQDVSFKEINILLAWMKYYWAEYYISDEAKYEQQYYDKDIKEFANSSLLNSLIKIRENFLKEANYLENKYYRITSQGSPYVEEINE